MGHNGRVMKHEPRQARSIESTERMLTAAEQLLRTGGADALTVDAVIARAGTSNGAFYARFGNRNGLLEAMHERFLSGFGSQMIEVAARSLQADSLRSAFATFIDGLFANVRIHRDTIAFHVIVNAHDPVMRAQGNQTTKMLTGLIEQIITHHTPDTEPARVEEMADFVVRLLMGLSLQILIFDDDEVTGRAITPERWNAHAVHSVIAYITA